MIASPPRDPAPHLPPHQLQRHFTLPHLTPSPTLHLLRHLHSPAHPILPALPSSLDAKAVNLHTPPRA